MNTAEADPRDQPRAADRDWPLARPEVRLRIAVLAVAFAALFIEALFRIVRIAWTDGDWSHAFLIPLIAAYFIHQRRDRLAAIDYRTFWPGLALAAAAVVGYLAAVRSGLDPLKGYAMIGCLFGLTLTLAGPAAIRVLWLPIVYLAFAVKLPDELWSQIAWKLQLFAAHSSVLSLMVIGVDANVTSTTIELFSGGQSLGTLNVAEACSGMRMLITFAALGVAVAYLSDRSWWARLILFAAAVPIALVINVGRVTLLGVLYQVDTELASGDFHLFMGMLMLIPALGLFMFVGWLVALFDEREPEPADAASSAVASPPPESPAPLKPDLSPPRAKVRVPAAAFPPPTRAALALLLLAAAVLYGSVYAAGFHLLKPDTPIRRHLFRFPDRVGPYARVAQQTLSREMTDELGSGEYVIWTFRRDGAAERSPPDSITVLLAYHAGSPDAAPYVSPRCYVAGGVEPTDAIDRTIRVAPAGAAQPIDVPLRLFAVPARPGEPPGRAVIAFTHIANGRLVADPPAVTDALFDPAVPQAWWCRVELLVQYAGQPDAAADAAADFLAHALPPIMQHLPAEPPPPAPLRQP